MQKKFITKSNLETIALGSKLGSELRGGEFFALTGDLGGGKTQFTKGIAHGLGITETIVSPTFTIERIYALPRHSSEGWNPVLHHFDLYRTMNDQEIAEGICDLASDGNNVVVVEWPENIEGILPNKYTAIDFKYIDDDTRELTIEEYK
jgi:tRNA threonylcarbamoyladenosine biosynthesis protein TsaE